MDRRSFLAVAGVVGTAGCVGGVGSVVDGDGSVSGGGSGEPDHSEPTVHDSAPSARSTLEPGEWYTYSEDRRATVVDGVESTTTITADGGEYEMPDEKALYAIQYRFKKLVDVADVMPPIYSLITADRDEYDKAYEIEDADRGQIPFVAVSDVERPRDYPDPSGQTFETGTVYEFWSGVVAPRDATAYAVSNVLDVWWVLE